MVNSWLVAWEKKERKRNVSPPKKTRLKLRGRLHTLISFNGHTLLSIPHTIEIEEEDKPKKKKIDKLNYTIRKPIELFYPFSDLYNESFPEWWCNYPLLNNQPREGNGVGWVQRIGSLPLPHMVLSYSISARLAWWENFSYPISIPWSPAKPRPTS